MEHYPKSRTCTSEHFGPAVRLGRGIKESREGKGKCLCPLREFRDRSMAKKRRLKSKNKAVAITTNRHFRYRHSGAQLNVLSGVLRRQENLDILGEFMGLFPQKHRRL